MGEVWRGRDIRLDREIAVKFVRVPPGADSQDMLKRFERESRITARLQHPGVPSIFDVGAEGDQPYLVMQLVHGLTVGDLIDQHGQLPIGWAAAIAAQTCSVLSVAHEKSLLHRDIKPSNLMVEPDGTVKVLDFGLAVALDIADMSAITRSGQNIGTPEYMAPEQVRAAVSAPQSDLYALGCTLFHMLTGEKLFTGTTSYSVMSQQADAEPRSVRSVRGTVPPELDALLADMLRKNQADRPATAQEVYDRLLPFVRDLDPLPGAPQPPVVPDPVRMYATVLSRAFTSAPGAQSQERSATPEPAQPDATRAANHATRAVSQADLVQARSEANGLAHKARFSQAAEVLAGMVEAASGVIDPHDEDLINARLEWANILFDGGDYRSAAPMYRDLVDPVAQRYGADSVLVFECRRRYAECHAKLGEFELALDVLHHVLEDQQRIFGARSSRTVDVRKQIGTLQLAAGHTEAGRATLQGLLDELVADRGESHPVVAQIRDLLSDRPGTAG
ncbi:serine/threonine protein kinase [Haloechinothrix sp. LS1_15]|nr:serine/threonine protein kinase [Haloechinothrix sp. LS1_15]